MQKQHYTPATKEESYGWWRTPERESLAAAVRALFVRLGKLKGHEAMDLLLDYRDPKTMPNELARRYRHRLDLLLDGPAA